MSRSKTLTEQAMSCITMARAIDVQFPDPAKMPADKFHEQKSLIEEGNRLREMADAARQQEKLEGWAAAPAEDHPALVGMAEAQHSKAEMGEALEGVKAQRQAKAFLAWMRDGKSGLPAEMKADLVEDATGQVLVPHDITTPIFKELPHLATFRRSGAATRGTTSNIVDVRSLTNATAGWGQLELGATPPTDVNVVPNTPVSTITVHDLNGLAKIGVDELADTDVANLPGVIQQAVGLVFAQMEDDAFANGSGTSRPFGLALRATQASPVITQSVTAAGGTVTSDNLKSLPFQVPTSFRDGGAYYVADDLAMAMALLKDGNSNYLWQPSVRAGEPATFAGYRVYTLEGLPRIDSGNSTPSGIFGDASLGYLIADRQQIAVQRLDELYATAGMVGFLFKLRVGGDVIRPKAFAKYIVV